MLHGLKKRVYNIGFRNKLILSYILIALIPLAAFAAICGSVFLAQAQHTAMAHTVQMVEQVSRAIDVYIGTMDKTTDFIASSLGDNFVQDWPDRRGEIRRGLGNIAASQPEIAGILVATGEDDYVSTGMDRISRDPFSGEDWYRQAAENPGSIVLLSKAAGRNIQTTQDYSVDNVFSLSKAVRDESGEVAGVILMDVRHDIIESSIGGITIGGRGFVFVTDQKGDVVYTPVNDVVYRVNPNWLDGPGTEAVPARIGGEQYRICHTQSDYTGWKTVGVFSQDEIMASVNAIVYVLAACMVLVSLLVLMVSFYLSATVLRPVMKLRSLMRQAESGDLSVRFNSRYDDEIGELGHSFNHMIDRIENLIYMVYEEQQHKRNAELKSLQEQIKPHFLYNTLDTISWMAREYEAADIVRLVDALTSMFRIGLSHGKEFISLKEEITHVSNYLYIQKIRYKDKLSYGVNIPQSLQRHLVPKLILQPLVENAIYHGVKSKRGGGNIWVEAEMEEGCLVLRVRDDGAGVPQEQLLELQSQLEEHTPSRERSSFGLFYIQERIQLCYGREYGIRIDSVAGEGTTMTVRLPLREEGQA